MNKWCR